MTYTATSEGTLVEREVEDADFVRSSGWIARPCWVVTTVSHV
jgi:hypothetical protein